MKNLKEFKTLIGRYESITLEEISQKRALRGEEFLLEALTGFGSPASCSLCKAVEPRVVYRLRGFYEDVLEMCTKCVYGYPEACHKDPLMLVSYYEIEKASTDKELLRAYRNRAKAMRELLKTKNVEI